MSTMALESAATTGPSSHPGVRSLLLATGITILLSFVPFARVVTYPFLIFSTFIHETGHALAAVSTSGSVDSLLIHWDGSGVTYTRGGLRALVSSSGYLGTALFGGLLLLLSRNRKFVRPALLGCAILVALITTAYVGHTNNLLVLITFTAVALLIGMSAKSATSSGRFRPLAIAGVIFAGLIVYLIAAQSLFSWSVGLFATLGLLAIARFVPIEAAHFFLSFLAVQCALNSLQAIYTLYSLSVSASCRTDAQAMASLTGIPAVFWAIAWALLAIIILACSLWLFSRGNPRDNRIVQGI